MSSDVPLWFGRERGIDLTEFASFEDDEEEEGQGEYDVISSSVFGTIVVALVIAATIAVMTAATLPLWMVVLAGIAGAVLVAWALLASWQAANAEEPSGAAGFTVMVMAGIGDVVVVAAIIGGILAIVAVIIATVAALSSGRR